MKTTNNLFLIGFMGAGKSSVSAALGKKLGWNVIEMDERIAADEGMSIPEIFAQKGEAHFRACETALLYSFAKGNPCIVSCGGGVPMREENVIAMRQNGTIVLLTARPEVILERVKDSDERPLLQNRKSVEGISELMEQRRPKYEAAADVTVDTSDLNIDQVCQAVLQQVNN